MSLSAAPTSLLLLRERENEHQLKHKNNFMNCINTQEYGSCHLLQELTWPNWPKGLVLRLEALEDVDSAATAVASERADLTDANLLSLVGVRGGALRDTLGASATLLQDVTTAKLAVKGALRFSSVTLHGHAVRGSNKRSSNSGKYNKGLEHS